MSVVQPAILDAPPRFMADRFGTQLTIRSTGGRLYFRRRHNAGIGASEFLSGITFSIPLFRSAFGALHLLYIVPFLAPRSLRHVLSGCLFSDLRDTKDSSFGLSGF